MFSVSSIICGFAIIWVAHSEHTEQEASLPKLQDIIVEAATILNGSCGEPCLEVLRHLNDSSKPFDGTSSLLHTLFSRLGSSGLHQAQQAKLMEDNMQMMRAQTEFSDDSVSSKFLQVGVRHAPCRTSSECQLLELRANRCSYGRLALQSAYEALNVGVHVLGVVTSLACGCVSTPTSEVICAMENVPNVCGFPAAVHAKMFAQSVQTWEAVKRSTVICMMHGDPTVAS
mmetsp:Transcript_60951/g.161868  ORF Transcript_60951/g.161868 Transcript_60951/m.161868 type:complete len:229 (-) Transcript_60951:81-767(-)